MGGDVGRQWARIARRRHFSRCLPVAPGPSRGITRAGARASFQPVIGHVILQADLRRRCRVECDNIACSEVVYTAALCATRLIDKN